MDEAHGVSTNQSVEHRAAGSKTAYTIARVCNVPFSSQHSALVADLHGSQLASQDGARETISKSTMVKLLQSYGGATSSARVCKVADGRFRRLKTIFSDSRV
jgi:hypothetical protein